MNSRINGKCKGNVNLYSILIVNQPRSGHFPDMSLTFRKIPDISLTAVKIPDISRFSRQVVKLDAAEKFAAW